MSEAISMRIIAHIRSDFPTKFGIPRQSGLVETLRAAIVFEPEYRNPDALRGIEGFSHIWLLWEFSAARREGWSPTVRPPRMGGNTRMGVFATRSPFRPNAVGLSSVRLEGVNLHTPEGPVLYISGADLMDGSPILDIKPYLPYTDAHPDAKSGFAPAAPDPRLEVDCPSQLLERLPADRREALLDVLAQDPRPAYQHTPDRVYGMVFAGNDVRFRVEGERLTILEIRPEEKTLGDSAASAERAGAAKQSKL
ncbi:MAG: tRNA (N6-threonylcarbamoyladenosine(37)-N6)-methyltransferase TrmO [Candidatus Howiella sp.]|jgi:tRNA-Thr(GGU) m(6)t(6)A37 methyltransferase TsaA